MNPNTGPIIEFLEKNWVHTIDILKVDQKLYEQISVITDQDLHNRALFREVLEKFGEPKKKLEKIPWYLDLNDEKIVLY